jgi:hypothetical protein
MNEIVTAGRLWEGYICCCLSPEQVDDDLDTMPNGVRVYLWCPVPAIITAIQRLMLQNETGGGKMVAMSVAQSGFCASIYVFRPSDCRTMAGPRGSN